MDVTIRVTGVREIDAVLKGMPIALNHKVLQAAHSKAVKVTEDRAKLLAPEGPTGNLIDSIGTEKIGFAKATELGLIYSGPRRRGRYKGHHAHLVEHGTRSRTNKKGANRGVMPKKPYMLPAWNQTKGQVISSVNDNVGRSLRDFMRRRLKGGWLKA